MGGIHLPTFISAVKFDAAIRSDGDVPSVTVQCTNCGAMGVYDDWSRSTSPGEKLCPSCGRYCGERI